MPTHRGPLAGQALPIHGGRPDAAGCNGCIDCCHLPEISITDEEGKRLQQLYTAFDRPLGSLEIRDDPDNEGWQIMHGPCVFRHYDEARQTGGCRIYDDRPAGCDIFTCELRTALRRAG